MMHQFAASLLDMNWWTLTLSQYVLHPFIMIILCLLSVFVVLGNLLVVSAIWHESQLHSVTNYLIASLAAADCLVGAVVMPFSIISEIIIGSWTFGATWCDLWHSFDVLASTASIMNLCAISLDRYLAITDPISYPRRMTPKRVALLIVSLWTCSSLISFPAIIWWRAVGQGSLQQLTTPPQPLPTAPISSLDMSSAFISLSSGGGGVGGNTALDSPTFDEPAPLYRCVFTDDTYYLLFSSFISFYGPLCVMLYAYYRIYKAAVQQTRFLKHGSKQVMIGRNKKSKRSRYISEHSTHGIEKNSGGFADISCDGTSNMDSYQRQHLVLRAHRGGGGGSSSASSRAHHNGGDSITATNKSSSDKSKRESHNCESSKTSFENETTTHEMGKGVVLRVETPTNSTSDDLDQSNLSSRNNNPPESPHQVNSTTSNNNTKVDSMARRNQALSRMDRIDLTSSRRDKLRVDSQRFDSKLIENVRTATETTTTTTTMAPAATIISGNNLPKQTNCNSTASLGRVTGLTSSSQDEMENREAIPSSQMVVVSEVSPKTKGNHPMQYKQQKGKPLLASINNRSTSIDVSIINRSTPPSNICVDQASQQQQQQQHRKSDPKYLSNYHHNHHQPHHHHQHHYPQQHQQLHSSFINSTKDGSSGGSFHGGGANFGYGLDNDNEDDDEEELSDDLVESESMSSSSGSYGTGSIVSVMMRPQQQQQSAQKNSDEMRSRINNDNCDNTNESQSSNPTTTKLRRALSYAEARHRGSVVPRVNINEFDDNVRTTTTPSPDDHLPAYGNSIRASMHRASCGDPSFSAKSSAAMAGLKNAKTLNIRSWVKLTRPRRRKSESNQGNRSIKPPPSLVPLMMMNSDTSTDSSILAGAVKRQRRSTATDRPGESDNNDEGEEGTTLAGASEFNPAGGPASNCHSDTTTYSAAARANYDDYDDEPSGRTSSRLKRTESRASKGSAGQIDKNLSFKEDLERGGSGGGKGQMLYYDSDKLIQSIVDLTDIRYIDCTTTNQATKSGSSSGVAIVECAMVEANTMEAENRMNQLDPAEHVRLSDSVRVNHAPRQNRSVGKKLSKLAKERKAAKTLGIVVGVFILCWLPFFVVNIVVALCGHNCIYKFEIFIAIVTWLGWLNSAMNPVIYACWSRDFRRAFRRVLCTWVEFVCPYDEAYLAKKLKLKKCSNYSNQEAYLNRNASSLKGGNTSSATIRSGVSSGDGGAGGRGACNSINGGASRGLLSDQP